MITILTLIATLAAVVGAVLGLLEKLHRSQRKPPDPPPPGLLFDRQLMVAIQSVSHDLATSRGYPEAAPFIANHLYDVVRHIERREDRP